MPTLAIKILEVMPSIEYSMPIMVLCLFAILVLITDLFLPLRDSHKSMSMAFLGLVMAFVSAIYVRSLTQGFAMDTKDGVVEPFNGMIVMDSFGQFFIFLILASLFGVLLFSAETRDFWRRRVGEYYCLVLVVAVGCCLLATANDLVMVYIAVEIMSIASYLLTGYLKKQRASAEAGLKYLVFGGVSSAVMLYGMSLLFGMSGQTNLVDIAEFFRNATHQLTHPEDASKLLPAVLPELRPAIWLSFIMIGGGIAYKLAAVPFHFWSPDAYQCAPTPVAGFLFVASKGAAFAVLIRFSLGIVAPYIRAENLLDSNLSYDDSAIWPAILVLVSVLSMVWGNFAAIRQTDVKRMLAYSSIAHAGYILMAVAVSVSSHMDVVSKTPATSGGFEAAMFYLWAYLFMNMGAFLVAHVIVDHDGSSNFDAYKGLVWRSPYLAVAMCIFLFSLAGVPPTVGFIGKFYLFSALLEEGWYLLALIGLFNSLIGLYYYIYLAKVMMFDKANDETEIHPRPQNLAALGLMVIPIVLMGVYWTPLLEFAKNSFSLGLTH